MSDAYTNIVSVLDEVAQPWMNESGEGGSCGVIRRMAEDAMKVRNWEEYTGQELQGIYWVAGIRPETEYDAEDYGRHMGRETGEIIPFVSLVEIEVYEDGELEITPVFGAGPHGYQDDWAITHFMEFQAPVHPLSFGVGCCRTGRS